MCGESGLANKEMEHWHFTKEEVSVAEYPVDIASGFEEVPSRKRERSDDEESSGELAGKEEKGEAAVEEVACEHKEEDIGSLGEEKQKADRIIKRPRVSANHSDVRSSARGLDDVQFCRERSNEVETDGRRDLGSDDSDGESEIYDVQNMDDDQIDICDVLINSTQLETFKSQGLDTRGALHKFFIEKAQQGENGKEQDAKKLEKKINNMVSIAMNIVESAPNLSQNIEQIGRLCTALLRLDEHDVCEPYLVPRALMSVKYSSMSDVATLIGSATNIVVLSGAGVSVTCGIPDFRSKDGLYDRVTERYGLVDPQAIFDLAEFHFNPSLFYSFAKEIMPDKDLKPSLTHEFIAELDRRGKLLRNYSQNIDGLESRTSVNPERVVLCHGSFSTATCVRPTCRRQVPGEQVSKKMALGHLPLCVYCNPSNTAFLELDDDVDDAASAGILKPDIVFFGESLPRTVHERMMEDIARGDLLLVLGTSLKVAPVSRIPGIFPSFVPRVLVNREPLHQPFNLELLGDCDTVIGDICQKLGWDMARAGKESKGLKQSPKVTFEPPARFTFPGAILPHGAPDAPVVSAEVSA